MKCFVWKYVDQCTGNYHSGGGVVVFAETLERAKALANAEDGCHISDDEMPDDVRDISGPEAVFIFQDAGCC